MKRKYDVFISYSHFDKATADAVCSNLEQNGIRCWYAPRDISPGADWAGSIMEAIEMVKIMVVVFTDRSNASRQVFNEITNAFNHSVIIIPFKLTKSDPSKNLQYYFTAVHWLDAIDTPLKESVDELTLLIKNIMSDNSDEKTEQKPKNKPGKRKLLLLMAVFCVVLLLGTFLFFPVRSPDHLHYSDKEWEQIKSQAFGVNMDRTYPYSNEFHDCWAVYPMEDGVLQLYIQADEGEKRNDLRVRLVDENQRILKSAVFPKEQVFISIIWNIEKGFQYLYFDFIGTPVFEQRYTVEMLYDGKEGRFPTG